MKNYVKEVRFVESDKKEQFYCRYTKFKCIHAGKDGECYKKGACQGAEQRLPDCLNGAKQKELH